MRKGFRVDVGRLDSVEERPDGSVLIDGSVTRVGVFEYVTDDGVTVRELRPPEEVLSAESLKSLRLVPFTNEHPPSMLDISNIAQYRKGQVGEKVTVQDSLVSVPIVVEDLQTLGDIQRGKLELSSGYFADIDETPGVWEGEPYDRVQRNIRYNHVALVDRGRAGPNVRLRMDGADTTLDTAYQVSQMSKPRTDAEPSAGDGGAMTTVEVFGQKLQVSSEAAMAIGALQHLLESAGVPMAPPAAPATDEGENLEEKPEEETMLDGEDETKEVKADKAFSPAAQAKIDSLESELAKYRSQNIKKDSAAKFDAAVAARVELESAARKFYEDAANVPKFAGKKDHEIKLDALKLAHPSLARLDAIDLAKANDRSYVDFLWQHTQDTGDTTPKATDVDVPRNDTSKRKDSWAGGPPKLTTSIR